VPYPQCSQLPDVNDKICSHCYTAVSLSLDKQSNHASLPPHKLPVSKINNNKKVFLVVILIMFCIAILAAHINFLKLFQPGDLPPGSTLEDPLGIFSGQDNKTESEADPD